ncbi:MAG: hypothetical protein WD795_05625 [Woeseia sp.]
MANPIAVVVGLCAHGLAIARSLSRAGVHVVAIEANRSLPGIKTCTAEVKFVDDINGAGLVSALISLAATISATTVPILFLTNDTMVETVGRSHEKLSGLFRISWGSSRADLLPLLRKKHVYQRCVDVGLLHPRSKLVSNGNDLTMHELDLRFPLIFKPDKPVSDYKTLVVGNTEQLKDSWKTIQNCLPAIAQEFIPGDDSKLLFAALYLDHGKVIARFEGRKLRSRPMGHTTVAIGETNDKTHQMARQFFSGLEFSGPVSLEIKEDPTGDLWVIEPTVGRSDFWVGLCINDGIDFPLIEYCQESCRKIEVPKQQNRTLWINEERDPAVLTWLMFRYPRYLLHKRTVGVYMRAGDFRPFVKWAVNSVTLLPERFLRKLMKTFRPNVGYRNR